MKKFSSLFAVAAIITGLFAFSGAQAGHCERAGGAAGSNAHDKFGSCESNGDVHCADDATDAGGLFTVDTAATGGNGVQVCNEGTTLPAPVGRAGVYTDGSSVQVHVDGDRDQVGSNGWTRVDASASEVCVRRGSGGSYSNAAADVADQCAP